MKRYLTIGVWLIAVALGINYFFLSQEVSLIKAANARMEARPTEPFTIVLKESLLHAGTTQPGSTQTLAIRSDGSYVRMGEYISPTSLTTRTIQRHITFVTGEVVQVDEIRELTSGFLDGTTAVAAFSRDPHTNCVQFLDGSTQDGQIVLGPGTENGYTITRINLGRRTAGFAPALSCAEVYSRTDVGDQGTSEKRLHSVVRGEPVRALFEVPARYQEVTLSVFNREATGSKEGQQSDKFYQSHSCPRCADLVRPAR